MSIAPYQDEAAHGGKSCRPGNHTHYCVERQRPDLQRPIMDQSTRKKGNTELLCKKIGPCANLEMDKSKKRMVLVTTSKLRYTADVPDRSGVRKKAD